MRVHVCGIPSTDIDISAGTVEFVVDVAPKHSDEEYDDREGDGYVPNGMNLILTFS